MYISREIENLKCLISRFLREDSSFNVTFYASRDHQDVSQVGMSMGCPRHRTSWDQKFRDLSMKKPNRPRWFRHPLLGNKGSRQLSYNVLIFAVSHTSSCAEYSIPLWRERREEMVGGCFLEFSKVDTEF